jgi:cell division protein FtsI/penicillin-binding protein 2
MSSPRLRVTWTAVALLALAASGCGSVSGPSGATSGADAAPVLHRYLAAWSHRDWRAMRALVTRAPAPGGFARANAEAFAALDVTSARFAAGQVRDTGPAQARGRVTADLRLRGLGTWHTTTTVSLVRRGGRWRVSWSPTMLDSRLPAGGRLALVRSWPARGQILGAGGAPLTKDRSQVTVGVVGERIRNASVVLADLVAAGAPRDRAQSALAAARAHPDQFEPVFEISRARFEQLRAAPGAGNVYAVPGTAFQATAGRRAITDQLSAHLVGSVGPVTAEQLGRLGPPYDASSVVGQSGLESAYERRLAGSPLVAVVGLDAAGARVATLATFAGRRARPVQTTIDPAVQRAAEAALAGETHNVAMVAIRASTGQVLATVSEPTGEAFDAALQGAYPPGSTFKVLVSAALIGRGLSPSSPVACPNTVTVDGETFHNAEGDGPTQTLDQAFTESCNTSFIDLALSDLRPNDLVSAAAAFGLKRTPRLGVPAFAANVTAPRSRTAMAAASIGQDTLTFSPLGMAMVAAAVDHGSALAPRLVAGAADDRTAAAPLPAAVRDGLRTMMSHVPESGTAAGTGLPAGTFAKTGTAQYEQDDQVKTDAWLMGYHGDIAFAIVVQDSGELDGGPRDGPLIARFLDAVDAAGLSGSAGA